MLLFLSFTATFADVHEELKVLHWHQLVNARHIFFPSAPPFGEVNDDADTNSQLEDESTESELFQEDKIPQELVIPQEAVISEDDLPTLRPKIKKNALVEISGHFATGSSSNRMSSYEVEHPSFLDDLHIDHEGQWLEINKKEQTQASPPAN